MIDFARFADRFPNWTITNRDNMEVYMVSKTINNQNEVLDILKYLRDLNLDNEWSLEIKEYSLTIKIKEKKKYNRIYTSGCFDIFHYGHLNILTKSKELCDYLIVGVSTDELILKEKGREPVIPFAERIKVVQAIGLVDEVIPQEDKNKQKIVDQYKIDAISVGDDWKGRYPKVSCAMEYFAYTPNVSSTILKDALKLTEKARS
jgi:glycerol-3-phosphate cytidylyltransferase